MNTFERSEAFDQWMTNFRDMKARARILQRIDSAMRGDFGDYGFIAEGVHGSQKRDIRQAIEMARNL